MVNVVSIDMKQQRDLVMLDILACLLIIFVLKIYWEPLIFMVVTVYIIINKDNALTANELYASLGIVTPILIHSVVSRFYTIYCGLLIAIPWFIIVTLIYVFRWKKKKQTRGGKKR